MKNGTNGTALDGVPIWLNDTLLANGTIQSNHTIHGHSTHSSLQTAVVDMGYIFTSICVVMVVLRTCIRPLNHEKYKIDDYAMIGSIILLAAITATNPLVISHGNNIDVGSHPVLSSKEIGRIMVGGKILLAARTLVLTYIWIMKACLLVHYSRLTTYTKELWIIRGAGFILAVTWLLCILTYYLECHPLDLFWKVLVEPPECAKAVTSVIVNAVTDIGTTMILMAIPIPIIMRNPLPLWPLFCIGLGYMLATFMIIMPMVKLVIVLNQSPERNLIWRELETFAATILANVPVIQGLHEHAWGHISSFKFGEDGCPAPKFGLQRDSSYEEDPIDSIISTRGRIRHSIMELRDKVTRNSESMQIRATTALMQESKTGEMDESEMNNIPAGMEDIFLGGGPSRGPVGTVTTQAFSESSKHNSFAATVKVDGRLRSKFRRFKSDVKESTGGEE